MLILHVALILSVFSLSLFFYVNNTPHTKLVYTFKSQSQCWCLKENQRVIRKNSKLVLAAQLTHKL